MLWEVTGSGKASQQKWCFCWASKDARKSTGAEKEEQRHPGWEQQEQRRREARTVRVVCLAGTNVLEWGKVDEARVKAKAAYERPESHAENACILPVGDKDPSDIWATACYDRFTRTACQRYCVHSSASCHRAGSASQAGTGAHHAPYNGRHRSRCYLCSYDRPES